MKSANTVPADSVEPPFGVVQTEQSYRQLPISLVVNLVNGAILTAVLWDAVPRVTLLAWAVALAAVTAGRYLVLHRFRRRARDLPADYSAWRRYFVAGAAAAGLVWGAAGVLLFHPQSFTHQVFLAFVLGGMVAGAMPLLSSVDWAYPVFAVPVVLPIGVQMLLVGDRVQAIMALMILVFGAAMLASAAQVRRLFRDSNSLRYKLSSSIEARHGLQEELRVDDLTGVANRRLLEEGLAREWARARRDHGTLAVIAADIDHFKDYNDRYGHPAGDECLVRVARAMAETLYRPGDVIARVGGEEFAFLLPGATLRGAQTVAEAIRQKVLRINIPHAASAVADQVTISLGVASSEQPTIDSPAGLFAAADAALYEAKRRGRNRSALYAPRVTPRERLAGQASGRG